MSEAEEIVDDIVEDIAEEVDVTTEVTDESVNNSTVDQLEALARENGWKPEDEWKGNPPKDGFKTAEQYVRDTFEINKTMHNSVKRMDNAIQELQKGEAKRMRQALEAQKERLEQQRQEAFEISDAETFNKVDEEYRKVTQELEKPEDNPAVKMEQEFIANNGWYNNNKTMTAFANTIAGSLKQSFPDISAEEFFQEVEQAVKTQFPNEFKNQRREGTSAVASGTRKATTSKKKGFDSLPPEAKQAYNEVKGYSKLSADDYAKAYYEMEK